jgi:hypothetical protein
MEIWSESDENRSMASRTGFPVHENTAFRRPVSGTLVKVATVVKTKGISPGVPSRSSRN